MKNPKLALGAIILALGLLLIPILISKFEIRNSNFNSTSENNDINSLSGLTDDSILKLKTSSGEEITLEVASTDAKRARGLMFREEMAENNGMIFIFDNEEFRTFHMGNTLISLDMIFLDKNLNVVTIHKNTKTSQSLETYSSSKPAMYVIEMNGGWTEKNRIEIGDRFSL